MINLTQNFKMEGFYSFKVYNSITGEERDVSNIIANDHKNMILDSGLNALGTLDICSGCKVGTGNSPVTETQTNLDASIASTNTIQSSSSGRYTSAPYYTWGRRTYRFAQGTAAGNLTEVGTYCSNNTSLLFSRALIVDSDGNPTTLTILADEWLDVTYELRIYQDLADKNFIVNLLGTDHTITVRPAYVTTDITSNASWFFYHMFFWYASDQCIHYNGAIGSITGGPSGTSASVSTTFSNYVSNSNERTIIMSSGLNDANLSGGITATQVRYNKAYWQIGYNPAIPKDSYKTLVLNLTISWSRYT